MKLDSLKNGNIHTFLIEEIRRKLTEMEKISWKINFCWVKAHVGIRGNEIATHSQRRQRQTRTSQNVTRKFQKV
jgi:ribonuclease HI